MAFARLSAILALALGASQLANAALTKRVTCATGQVTAHAACCGQSHRRYRSRNCLNLKFIFYSGVPHG
jgi:hypothetical protein